MTGVEKQNRPLVGVSVIIVRGGRVLVGKRRGAHGSGTWQFPGGHLEYGESLEACARREVREETGMAIGNIRFGPYTNDIFTREGKHYVTLFLIADWTGGEPELKEPAKCETWEWQPWTDLPAPRFLPMENLLKQGFDPFTTFRLPR